MDPLVIIRRDRDFVLNKWDVAEPGREPCECDCNTPMSFDDAIAMFKNNTFTISGMAFMDETNLDSERLSRCRVQVLSEDERLISFCGYYAFHRNKGL